MQVGLDAGDKAIRTVGYRYSQYFTGTNTILCAQMLPAEASDIKKLPSEEPGPVAAGESIEPFQDP